MLRSLFVLGLIAIGARYALRNPFYALLFYLWIAYFRPETWVWYDFISTLNLSFIAGVYLLYATVVSQHRFYLDLRTGFLILFLMHALLSTMLSPYAEFGWPYWQSFAKSVVVTYLITVLTTDAARFRAVLQTIGLSLGFEAAKQGWAQFLVNPGGKNFNEIPQLGDESGVAVGMMMLVAVLVALAQTTTWKWEQWVYRFLAVGVFYRGLATYSRGGFLACGALAGFYLLRSKHRIRTLAAMGLVAGLIFPVLPDAFWDRMKTISASEEDRDMSSKGRLHFWEVAIVMGNEQPITGIGFNAFNEAYDRYDFSHGEHGVKRSAHSVWFAVFAELGYVGLVLLLVNVFFAFQACSRVIQLARRHPGLQDLGAYAIALQASFGVFAVGGSFIIFQYVEVLWHFIGLSAALYVLAWRATAEAATTTTNRAPMAQAAVGAVARS